ncbi:hypothetical protein DC3_57660 [Deinococcus cellulosilyticus NBRC 106333 = KACC 11606]|uniref:Tc1-like transposase DDE domain-containing protein n=2 Tax=Deinococcus cellulosilyticus TaxID=401558 RepID=A0A511NCR4_DEIC1|nr:hypothetical protein DC3_57660 [Deinococcus cellulosilyticus NBRC 106333 = KACC 11606]
MTEMLYLTQNLRFHPEHFRKRVRQLGYSAQKAAVQSRERNQEQIHRWVKENLPELHRAAEQGTLVVCDEVGSSLKTLRGMTWAKKGKTPVLPTHGHWDNLSTIGGMTIGGKVYQQCYSHAIRAVQVVKFFKHLLRHMDGPLVLLLDNARIHRAKLVQTFLKSETGKRITIFHTPPYAPEFNPIEWLWSWIKRMRIQNLCPKNLVELKQGWNLGFRQVRSRPDLIRSFFRASSLFNIC